MGIARNIYRVMIIIVVLVVGAQYFYLNPIGKHIAITYSQFRGSGGIEPLFVYKTVKLRPLAATEYNETTGDTHSSGTTSGRTAMKASNSTLTILRNGSTDVQKLTTNSPSPSSVSEATKFCPVPPPNLLGFINVSLEDPPTLEAIAQLHPDLELGGRFRPKDCKSRDKVAIIIPFRDREEHLRIFLYNIHPVLKRQMVEYNIFVIEQAGKELFNRAMLFNVGYVEALKREKFDCFIFHDVDLIPENDMNLYTCPVHPRHMSVAVDKMHYQLPYRTIFGGISALRTDQFKMLNGFSNVFWGWGAEDDDMANRIAFRGMYISRPSPAVARYKMLKHKHQKLNNNRYKQLIKGKLRFGVDGLSSLNYTVDQIILEKLFTRIRVQLVRVGG